MYMYMYMYIICIVPLVYTIFLLGTNHVTFANLFFDLLFTSRVWSIWNNSEICPVETVLDFLKTDVAKNLISQELKHILPRYKKHWKAYLILLQYSNNI